MSSDKVSENTKQQVLNGLRSLPLSFVPNAGQTHAKVEYHAHGRNIFVTKEEIMFVLSEVPKSRKHRSEHVPLPSEHESSWQEETVQKVALALRFLSANPNIRVEARNKGTHTVNFFRGNETDEWYTSLPTYSELVYRNLWQGVDLVLKGVNGSLKYEFVVNPEASIKDIQLAYRGADNLSLDKEGNLQIQTPLGTLLDENPVSYQVIDGKRVAVESHFTTQANANGEMGYGFAIGSDYDPGHPLIIDPGLVYSTYLGGSNTDESYGIALDAAGNAYVTGYTYSTDFPKTLGAYQTAIAGLNDAFVTKLNLDGSNLLYSTYLGGNNYDYGRDLAIDETGHVYVTGYTYSTNFPITSGAYQSSFGGGSIDAFITKLTPDGSELVYSTYLGGSSTDESYGIALDAAGSAYVTGTTNSTDFPIISGAQSSLAGLYDAFVTKLNPAGTDLEYSTYLGGNNYDYGWDLTIDETGNAYVTGYTYSTDFPIISGAYQSSFGGGPSDAFVSKLNSSGSSLVYSTYLGGSSTDAAYGIALDGSGSVYVTGSTSSTDFPTTTGAYQTSYQGLGDAIVAKLSPAGSGLVYSTYLGGSAADYGEDIVVDDTGYAYVTGYTDSMDFPTTPGAYQSSFGGGFNDAFVSKLTPAGSGLAYSTYLGGNSTDEGWGIALDGDGYAYVTGYTNSTDFPNTPDAYQNSLRGGFDAFVTKLDLQALLADLGITKAAIPDPVVVNDELTYTLTVENLGPAPATGVTVTDTLPVSVTFVSVTSTKGSCSESARVVTCAIGSMNVGETVTITIKVKPTVIGAIRNTAAVKGNEEDPNPDNNTSTAATAVVPPIENKMVLDITLKVLQKQQLSLSTTPPTGVKVPVVLTEPTLHIPLDDSFALPVPSAEIKSVANRLKLTQCLLALPSNVLFLKGYVRKNIQYVTKRAPRIVPGEASTSYTVDIPFSFSSDLTGKYLNPPVLPSMNTREKFEFFTSTPLPVSVPHSSKDELLAGDLTQFDEQSEEFFNELPYCELVSAEFVDYVEPLDT